METLFVAVHGWGFGPGFWRILEKEMPGRAFVRVDLGFSGRPSVPEIPSDRPVIGVGHSTGFPWLLRNREMLGDLRGLVSVNGFTRFTRCPGYPQGVHPRVLARMKSGMEEDPGAVLQGFQENSGLVAPVMNDSLGGLLPDRLQEGLDWIASWDERESLAALEIPVLALAARDDLVVTAAMSAASFETIDWAEEGGHVLPINRADWVAERIEAFSAC